MIDRYLRGIRGLGPAALACVLAMASALSAGEISGFAWTDVNQDGVQDSIETLGVPGVNVDLYDASTNLITSATTDAVGNYEFTGLAVGTYFVIASVPTGMLLSPAGGDSIVDSMGTSGLLAVPATGTVVGADLGYYNPDPESFCIDNWEIGQTNTLMSPMSQSSFALGSMVGGERDLESVLLVDGGGGGFRSSVNAIFQRFTHSEDAGYIGTSLLVWDGADASSAIDFEGLGGISMLGPEGACVENEVIEFTARSDFDVDLTLTIYTDAINFSEFSLTVPGGGPGLTPSMISIPFSSLVAMGGSGADLTNIGAISLQVSDQGSTDFQIISPIKAIPTTACLGDRVWEDLNADGLQDVGEPGVANVPVTLYDSNSVAVTSTMTDANGFYQFSDLVPGDYTVEFGLPAGYVRSPDLIGAVGFIDSNPDEVTGLTGTINLAPGEHDRTIDSGIYQPASLGNLVWLDIDRDGIYDGAGEPGIGNVPVELFQMVGGSLISVSNTMTDGTGFYEFTGLVPGDYFVQFTTPAGYVSSPSNVGTNDAVDSDPDASGFTTLTTLISGENDPTWDAGLYRLVPGAELTKNVISPLGRPAEVGEQIVFEIVLSNTGEVPFATTPMMDSWNDTYLSFMSASPAETSDTSSSLTWADLGPLATGDSHTVTVTFIALESTLGVTEVNGVTSAPTTPPGEFPVPPLEAEDVYEVLEPNYTLVKNRISPANSPVLVGQKVVFQITIANTGEVPLTVVPVTDTWDSTFLTFDTASPAVTTASAGTLTWANVGPIPVSGSTTITVTYDAIASTDLQPELNVAETTPMTPGSTLPTMEDDAPYTIGEPSYTITKTRTTPLDTEVGETVSFDIVITNDGEIDLQTVPLADTYDASLLQFINSSPLPPTSPVAGNLAWADLGFLAVGNSHTMTVNFTALESTSGFLETNTAATTPTTLLGPLPTMEDEAPYRIIEPGYLFTKTRLTPLDNIVGDTVTFRLTVLNTGEVTLVTVPVVDNFVSATLAFDSATPAPSTTGSSQLIWNNIGPLTPGQAASIDVSFDVIATTSGALEDNVASTTPSTPSGPLPPMEAEAPYRVLEPSYVMTKTRTSMFRNLVGDTVTFDITVTNDGDVPLTTVPVLDTFDPSTLAFLSALPPADSTTASTASWSNIGPIAPGNSETITVNFEALQRIAVETNVVSTTPSIASGPLPTQEAEDVYSVVVVGYTSIKQVVSPVPAVAGIGDTIVFRIDVTNTGDVELIDVPVTDFFDMSTLSFLNSSPTADVITPSAITWSNVNAMLLPSQTLTITASFEALKGTGGQTINNIVVVSPTTPTNSPPVIISTNPAIYEIYTATVGNYVWEDLDYNGIQDAGEPPVPGAVVTLRDLSGSAVSNLTTDANGQYLFEDIPLGDYYIEVIPPNGYDYTLLDSGTNDARDSDIDPVTGRSTQFNMGTNEVDLTWDAGLWRPASIGDFIWLDLDNNGKQDTGEPGVSGVEVVLFNGTTPVATNFTGASGLYTFTGLTPGDYSVQVNPPASYTVTTQDAQANSMDAMDSDINPTTGTSLPVSLESGETNDTIDGGLFQTTTIGDRVWLDENANGVQDPTENTGVQGVRVILRDAAGIQVAQMFTDANGNYLFDALAPGMYSLTFLPPVGYERSPQDIGSDILDSDADPASGDTIITELTAGEVDLTWDAGIYLPASLGNRVWLDDDTDGEQDASETTGFANLQVELLDANGAVVMTTLTDAAGLYEFTGLVPGTYSVRFTAPPTFFASPANNIADDTRDSDVNPQTLVTAPVTLGPGENNDTLDAGFYPPARIGNFVWLDDNANGIQDPNETTGIPNVPVILLDENNMQISSTTTDANGFYLFSGLERGVYTVRFDLDPLLGYTITQQGVGPEETDSDVDAATGLSDTIDLEVEGDSYLNLDLGVYRLASLGDTVWFDLNNNGDPSDEALGTLGIPGATVTLERLTGAPLTLTTVTASTPGNQGFYSFDNLEPGTYRVTIDPSTLPDDASAATTPQQYEVTLVAGQNVPTLDFGYIANPTAIDLLDLSATKVDAGTRVDWKTGSEEDLLGFRILWAASQDAEAVTVSELLLADGNGRYSWTDTKRNTGVYWLEAIDNDLSVERFGPAKVAAALLAQLKNPTAPSRG